MGRVSGLYDSHIDKERACGYCYYHKCHLTVRQLKSHKCLQKNCNRLERYEDHQWWKQRERAKAKKKLNKEITKLLV